VKRAQKRVSVLAARRFDKPAATSKEERALNKSLLSSRRRSGRFGATAPRNDRALSSRGAVAIAIDLDGKRRLIVRPEAPRSAGRVAGKLRIDTADRRQK
jgi:hypothetical protein